MRQIPPLPWLLRHLQLYLPDGVSGLSCPQMYCTVTPTSAASMLAPATPAGSPLNLGVFHPNCGGLFDCRGSPWFVATGKDSVRTHGERGAFLPVPPETSAVSQEPGDSGRCRVGQGRAGKGPGVYWGGTGQEHGPRDCTAFSGAMTKMTKRFTTTGTGLWENVTS